MGIASAPVCASTWTVIRVLIAGYALFSGDECFATVMVVRRGPCFILCWFRLLAFVMFGFVAYAQRWERFLRCASKTCLSDVEEVTEPLLVRA